MGVSAFRVFYNSDSFRQTRSLWLGGYRQLLPTIIDNAPKKALKTEEAV
jgi:hypothetical protein